MRIFFCNGVSLHNSCSVIEKFGLSEGSLAFVFGSLALWIGTLPQFQCFYFSACSNKIPDFSARLVPHLPNPESYLCVQSVTNMRRAPLLLDLQQSHILQGFGCASLQQSHMLQSIHLQEGHLFLYLSCTHLQDSRIFLDFQCINFQTCRVLQYF